MALGNTRYICLRYLNTYASTALNYEQSSAEEGSLHETEYLAPYTREGETVYLLGYVFEKKGCALNWRTALSRLQLGGERKYGWGRVQLYSEPQQTTEFWPAWKVTPDTEYPQLEAEKDAVLYAHLLHTASLAGLRGNLEPLVGRETRSAANFGNTVTSQGLAWAPGAQVPAGQKVKLSEYGLWRVVA